MSSALQVGSETMDTDPDDSSPSSSSDSNSSSDEHGIGFPKGSESEFTGGSDDDDQSLSSNDKTNLVRFHKTIIVYIMFIFLFVVDGLQLNMMMVNVINVIYILFVI